MKNEIIFGNYKEGSRELPVRADLSNIGKDSYSILVTGGSGSGKTVKIQKILMQLAEAGKTVYMLDIHNTMCPDQIYGPYRSRFESLAIRHDGYKGDIPCGLLTPATYPDGTVEAACDVAGALAEIITTNYSFGSSQYTELSSALEDVIETGSYLRSGFQAIETALLSGGKVAQGVARRLRSLFRHNVFCDGNLPLAPGKINIMDLSKYDPRTQTIISEILLYNLWHGISTGSQREIFVSIDEFQNIGMKKSGILSKMLAEGRKYGLNLILITQSLGIHFSSSQQKLLCQARYKLFFRPSEADAKQVASLLSSSELPSSCVRILNNLKTGECLISGPVYIGDESQPICDAIRLLADRPDDCHADVTGKAVRVCNNRVKIFCKFPEDDDVLQE